MPDGGRPNYVIGSSFRRKPEPGGGGDRRQERSVKPWCIMTAVTAMAKKNTPKPRATSEKRRTPKAPAAVKRPAISRRPANAARPAPISKRVPPEEAKAIRAASRSDPADFEKETIITFNEAEPMATIFTYNRAWQQGLRALGLRPTMNNGHGGLEFQLAKSRISPPWGRAGRVPAKTSVKPAAKKAGPRRRQLELFPREF